MSKKFSVTYEIITPESAENGDVEESGYVDQDLTLREAINEFSCDNVEMDSYPCSLSNPPRWFTGEYNVSCATGAEERRSLHLPRNITPSSAMRIARLLCAYGVR
jgi:hypothetical protein